MNKIKYQLRTFCNLIFLVSLILLAIQCFGTDLFQINSLNDRFTITIIVLIISSAFSILLGVFGEQTNLIKEVVYVDRIAQKKEEVKVEDTTITDTTRLNEALKQIESITSATDLDAKKKLEKVFAYACDFLQAGQGLLYKTEVQDGQTVLSLYSTYAFITPDSKPILFHWGEGLVGSVAKENKVMKLDEVPNGYIKIFSGLGSSSPRILLLAPVGADSSSVIGVIELAFFNDLDAIENSFFESFNKELYKLMSRLV